jgi:hypothetical protein
LEVDVVRRKKATESVSVSEKQQAELSILLDHYWTLVMTRSEIRANIIEARSKIANIIGGVYGDADKLKPLNEDRLENGIELSDAGDKGHSSIINFLMERRSTDWNYLARVLTPAQLRRARRVSSRKFIVRIQSNIMKAVLADFRDESDDCDEDE